MITQWRNLFPCKTGLGFAFQILSLEQGGVFTNFTMEMGWVFTFQNQWLRCGDIFRTFTFPWKTGLVMGGAFSAFSKSEWLRVGETFHAFTFPWKTGLVMDGLFFTFTFTFQNLTNGR